jgi:hypothetical protein
MTTEDSYTIAAKTLGVEPALLAAFAQVESAGSGWISDGRPKIRFEDHVFARKCDTPMRDLPPRGRGSEYYAREWDRFEAAAKVCRDAAIESTSWRKFQIMGFNWATTGFESLDDFYEKMNSQDYDDIHALVEFIRHRPRLTRAMRDKDWHTIARVYNGRGREHIYAPAMARAYRALK